MDWCAPLKLYERHSHAPVALAPPDVAKRLAFVPHIAGSRVARQVLNHQNVFGLGVARSHDALRGGVIEEWGMRDGRIAAERE